MKRKSISFVASVLMVLQSSAGEGGPIKPSS